MTLPYFICAAQNEGIDAMSLQNVFEELLAPVKDEFIKAEVARTVIVAENQLAKWKLDLQGVKPGTQERRADQSYKDTPPYFVRSPEAQSGFGYNWEQHKITTWIVNKAKCEEDGETSAKNAVKYFADRFCKIAYKTLGDRTAINYDTEVKIDALGNIKAQIKFQDDNLDEFTLECHIVPKWTGDRPHYKFPVVVKNIKCAGISYETQSVRWMIENFAPVKVAEGTPAPLELAALDHPPVEGHPLEGNPS